MQLTESRFGISKNLEAYEAMGRDAYSAAVEFPYLSGTIILDGLALIPMIWSCVIGRFRILVGLVWLVWIPSTAWHGVGWIVSSIFV